MSEQKPTEHTDTPKTTRTAPSMASMAAAIHAAPVRAPQKPARTSQTSDEKPGDASTAEPGAKRDTSHKNSSRKNNASRSKNPQKRAHHKNHRDRPEQRPYNPLIPAEITYPEELPVSERREDIKSAIRDHQVIIVAGETGSGKTTQLPKMCLELGLAEKGMIGHTQPRRLAARSVAERIAEELGQKIGETVGYQVRFTSEVGENSAIKLMTDGILLAEIQHDKLLRK